LNSSESRSEICGRFGNVVLKMDGKDQFDRWCEKLSFAREQAGEENLVSYTQKKRRKGKWIGGILRRNCVLKYVFEEKIEER
jgi:hypothetical protein